MIKYIKWFFSPSTKSITGDNDLYQKFLELEKKCIRLEEENVETSNILYELMNSIEAIDSRIDILAEYCRISENV